MASVVFVDVQTMLLDNLGSSSQCCCDGRIANIWQRLDENFLDFFQCEAVIEPGSHVDGEFMGLTQPNLTKGDEAAVYAFAKDRLDTRKVFDVTSQRAVAELGLTAVVARRCPGLLRPGLDDHQRLRSAAARRCAAAVCLMKPSPGGMVRGPRQKFLKAIM